MQVDQTVAPNYEYLAACGSRLQRVGVRLNRRYRYDTNYTNKKKTTLISIHSNTILARIIQSEKGKQRQMGKIEKKK